MKKSALHLLLILGLLFISTGEVSAQSSKTFKVGKGGTLDIVTTFGDIKIKSWDKNEILVKYDIDEDEEIYSGIKFNQNGNDLTIRATQGYGTSFDITVPVNFNLKIVTSAGDIHLVNAITGEVNASTSGGDVTLSDVTGKVKLTTGGGDVRTGNIKGTATVSSSGGDLNAGVVDGDAVFTTGGGNVQIATGSKTLTVSTAGGNVSVGNTGGNATVTTGGGNISLGKVGGTAVVKTGGGDIKVDNVSGDVKGVTGSGNITLHSSEDKVNVVSGSGDLVVSFYPGASGDSKVVTGFGDIKLYIPENSRTTIVAKVREGGWGDSKNNDAIKSDFPITTENKDGISIITHYQLNGGGSTIYVETGSGTIELRKLKK